MILTTQPFSFGLISAALFGHFSTKSNESWPASTAKVLGMTNRDFGLSGVGLFVGNLLMVVSFFSSTATCKAETKENIKKEFVIEVNKFLSISGFENLFFLSPPFWFMIQSVLRIIDFLILNHFQKRNNWFFELRFRKTR